MLTESYVSFETAKLLKEKGFKQDCDYATLWYAAEYYKNSAQGEWFEGEHQIIKDIDDKCTISYLSDKSVFIPAPTQSLALKWLREVHKIHIYAKPYWPQGDMRNKMSWQGFVVDLNTINGDSQCYADSPEEAIENRIKFALENLI